MAQRLTAQNKLKRLRSLQRRVRQAEKDYRVAVEQDRLELVRRKQAKAAHQAVMEERKRARIIVRAARKRKAPWYERVRVHMMYPTIG